jgi:acyl carrier protein
MSLFVCQAGPVSIPMTPDIYPLIAKILADQFHVEAGKFSPDSVLEDLGLDSLALMEFVFAVEDKLGLRLPEDRLDPRQAGITLAHLSEVIDSYRAEISAGSSKA